DDRVVLAGVEALGRIADDGGAAGVAADRDPAVLLGGVRVAGLGDRAAQRHGSSRAAGDLRSAALSVAQVAGV
ncbi:MAG: hypothetical protein AVDCRST_MAG17-1146, partial [uncultured Solirubrobacterales bacterium]